MKLINKIAENMFSMSEQDIQAAFNNRLDQLGFEGVDVIQVDTEFGGDTVVTFLDEDGDELDVLFTLDPEEGAIAVIFDDDDDFENDDMEEGEIDLVDLDSLDPKIIDLGDGFQAIDLVNLEWFNASGMIAILNSGDFLDDEDDHKELGEAKKVVIRGGKKVKLALVRRKRKKRLTPKQKAGVKRGARKRKAKSTQINRKRKKSLKLRKRSGIKQNKNKRMKIAGTS